MTYIWISLWTYIQPICSNARFAFPLITNSSLNWILSIQGMLEFWSCFDAKFLGALYQQRHAGVWGSSPTSRYLSAFCFTLSSSFLFLSFACALAPSAICFICSISIWYLCIALALLISSSLCTSCQQLSVRIACINLCKMDSWLV